MSNWVFATGCERIKKFQNCLFQIKTKRKKENIPYEEE